MGFSQAQYHATIEQLTSGTRDLSSQIAQVPPTAAAALKESLLPPQARETIQWCADTIVELATWVVDTITELLKGALAPVLMFQHAWDWQTLRGKATDVAGQLTHEALTVDDAWRGQAADAYKTAIDPQSRAAKRIAAVADRTATALTTCAIVALGFYVALGVILVKFLSTTVTALIALGSAVFSWAGIGIIVADAGISSACITTAVTALTAALGTQASEMSTLHGQALDATDFPGGTWPNPATANFTDGTVTDGDADWSVK